MAKSDGIRCGCGEVQFTVLNNYQPADGPVMDIIVCDSCARPYKKPVDFFDQNGQYE